MNEDLKSAIQVGIAFTIGYYIGLRLFAHLDK